MAGAFPGAPNNLDLHTTDGGTVYQYKVDHDRWVIYKDSTAYVEKAGDTMTGLLTVDNTGITSAAAENLVLNAPTGLYVYFKINGVEVGRMGAADLRVQGHLMARNAHNIYAYSAGNDKSLQMFHNDTDGFIHCSSGRIETRSTSLDVRNIADNDYVAVNADVFNEVSKALPDDPENWKELLPDFLKTDVIHPITEKRIDEEGNITYEKIGEEIKIGINTGMTARLALREVELLKKEIEELKKIVGTDK